MSLTKVTPERPRFAPCPLSRQLPEHFHWGESCCNVQFKREFYTMSHVDNTGPRGSNLPDSINLPLTQSSIESELAFRTQIDVHHTTLTSR